MKMKNVLMILISLAVVFAMVGVGECKWYWWPGYWKY